MPSAHPGTLTGFIGERTNRSVAIATDDFRRYHELAPFFEEHGITLLGLAPADDVPAAVQAIIGGPPDDPRSVQDAGEPAEVWLRVMHRLDPRAEGHDYRRVVVGIDPGETIGLAVLADGAVFWCEERHETESVAAAVASWCQALPASQHAVHIGDGAPSIGQRIMAQVKDIQGVEAIFVPEQASTPATPSTLSRHTDAAIHIAMREAA